MFIKYTNLFFNYIGTYNKLGSACERVFVFVSQIYRYMCNSFICHYYAYMHYMKLKQFYLLLSFFLLNFKKDETFVVFIWILKNMVLLPIFHFHSSKCTRKLLSRIFFSLYFNWMQIWQLKTKRHQTKKKSTTAYNGSVKNTNVNGSKCFYCCGNQLKSIPY